MPLNVSSTSFLQFISVNMLAYRYPLIAREGWIWIAFMFVAAASTHMVFSQASIPLWVMTGILVFLFRDPIREIPALPLAIVCPVDGRVIAIEKVHDEYLDRKAISIRVRMSLTSVYSVHSPMEGKIMEQWMNEPRKYQPGNLDISKFTANKARVFAQWIQSDEKDDVVMVMEANMLIRRPHCYAHSGERIGQGQRCGFLRFGTVVDVLVPETSRVEVNIGEKVVGGSMVIATLVRSTEVQSAVFEEVSNGKPESKN